MPGARRPPPGAKPAARSSPNSAAPGTRHSAPCHDGPRLCATRRATAVPDPPPGPLGVSPPARRPAPGGPRAAGRRGSGPARSAAGAAAPARAPGRRADRGAEPPWSQLCRGLAAGAREQRGQPGFPFRPAWDTQPLPASSPHQAGRAERGAEGRSVGGRGLWPRLFALPRCVLGLSPAPNCVS